MLADFRPDFHDARRMGGPRGRNGRRAPRKERSQAAHRAAVSPHSVTNVHDPTTVDLKVGGFRAFDACS
jgi:hypothetical protein